MEKRISNTEKNYCIILSCMLLIFCFLKVLRGSDTESTATGGFWNYISLLYYPIIILGILSNRRRNITAIGFCLVFYVLLALFSSISNFSGEININSTYQFLMIPYFAIVFISFSYYSIPIKASEKIILLTFFICLGLNLFTIFKYQFLGAERPLASDIYFSLGLFPFALLILKNKTLKNISICLVFFAVFFSGKRTGLLAFVLAFVVYMIIDEYLSSRKNLISIFKTLFIIIVVLLLFYFISYYFDEQYSLGIYKRLNNLFEDGGSGRDVIYKTVWESYKEAPVFYKLFGHGMAATGEITLAYAHNDFLEILYNYGLIALIMIVVFYLQLIKRIFVMIRVQSPYAAAYAAAIVICLFLSMFSFMLIFYTYVTCVLAFLGYALALEDRRIQDLRSDNFEEGF